MSQRERERERGRGGERERARERQRDRDRDRDAGTETRPERRDTPCRCPRSMIKTIPIELVMKSSCSTQGDRVSPLHTHTREGRRERRRDTVGTFMHQL